MGTYIPIAKTVLTGTQATVTFSGIPATYTDLLLVMSARSDYAGGYGDIVKIRYNNSGADTNLTSRRIQGYNAAVTSGSSAFLYFGIMSTSLGTSNTFASAEVYIPNYTGSTNKPASSTSVMEQNDTTNYFLQAHAGLWSDTTAINRIDLISNTGSNFVSGSRFDLYGII